MHGEHHDIRICGHRLNWHKPIKPFVLIKYGVIAALFTLPAQAAEISPVQYNTKQALHAAAHPHSPVSSEKSVTGQAVRHDQRTAGSSSLSPAMVLAMAFGLRTATGPMLHSQKAMSPSTKDVRDLTGLDGRDALDRKLRKDTRVLSKKENISPRVLYE